MAGKKGSQMTGNCNRTHPWSATPVGNAKRLVQIQMTDIRADVAGPTNPNLRIHIRAIHIDLAAVGMNDLANAPDIGLEYPVRGWVGQHQGRQPLPMLRSLGFKVLQIYIALCIAGHGHNRHPDHGRAGWIGSMSRDGDEADVAMKFALAPMICPDNHQSRILPL